LKDLKGKVHLKVYDAVERGLKEVCWEWIHPTQVRDGWWAVVNSMEQRFIRS
jgi:hypothetical protein